jgi:predicted metal-binding transcription factor (methanogenesis marker protein 9)
MMNLTVVGLFESQEKAQNVSESLERTGIRNEDYIIYKTNPASPRAQKQAFWRTVLGLKESRPAANQDKLITSVEVRSDEELLEVKKSFAQNGAVNIYEFKDMTIEEAKDLNYIKKIVELRAKSHIYAMPAISLSSMQMSQGINAEVKA